MYTACKDGYLFYLFTQHVNEVALAQFENEDNIDDTLESMNTSVLPCLTAMTATPYQDDQSSVEEIREKWCSFLGKDIGKFNIIFEQL